MWAGLDVHRRLQRDPPRQIGRRVRKDPQHRSRCLDGKSRVCDIMANGADRMLIDRQINGGMSAVFISVY